MARHPNQISPFGTYRPKSDNPDKPRTPFEARKEELQRDLQALEALQGSRPLKPPGKR